MTYGEVSAKVGAEMLTDVGLVRARNEDAAHVDGEGLFFIVADGMGGQAAGDVASRMAVDIVRAALARDRDRLVAFAQSPCTAERREIIDLMERAVRTAHRAISDRGHHEPDKEGMGTTLDVVIVAGAEAFVAHVGDTRTYLIRGGDAVQLTWDHTMAELMIQDGQLSPDEAAVSPLRAVLVNAVGATPGDIVVEIALVSLESGDRLLLCTDGFYESFDGGAEIAERLATGAARDRLEESIELARERGGHDNITGVLVDIVEVEPVASADEATAVRSPIRATASSFADDDPTLPAGAWDAIIVELRDPV
jgi:serine/threonine protein phosphatase PrpC